MDYLALTIFMVFQIIAISLSAYIHTKNKKLLKEGNNFHKKLLDGLEEEKKFHKEQSEKYEYYIEQLPIACDHIEKYSKAINDAYEERNTLEKDYLKKLEIEKEKIQGNLEIAKKLFNTGKIIIKKDGE